MAASKEKKQSKTHVELPGIATRLKKDFSKVKSYFGPYPYEIDYEKLLAASEGNKTLVETVKMVVHEEFFDRDGNERDPSWHGFYDIKCFMVTKEEVLSGKEVKWIHIVFGYGSSIRLVAGAVGDTQEKAFVLDSSYNKLFVESMASML